MEQYFLIAEIIAVYGSDGNVVIHSYSDFYERFFLLKSAFIDFFGNRKEFIVENVTEFNGKITIKFKGFDTREEAKILIGKQIFVDEKNSITPDKNVYFIHDLIGSEVYIEHDLLGTVIDVLILPANDVYVIKDTNEKKILVPAVKDFIKNFDVKKKRLELVPGCDLLYDDEN